MEALIRKFNKWHILREKHFKLRLENERVEIRKKIEEVKKTKDIQSLLKILKEYPDKCEDLTDFLDQEFKRGIKFNTKERISCIIECMSLQKVDYSEARDMLLGHLQVLYSRIRGTNISTRVTTLEKFREYDKANGLKTFEYINDKISLEINGYLKDIPISNPKELDKWLNELPTICKYDSQITSKYEALEMRYFSMCFDLIKDGEREDIVEDAVYLINKIKKRSNIVGTDLGDRIKSKLNDCGLLNEDGVKSFFENLFPFLK